MCESSECMKIATVLFCLNAKTLLQHRFRCKDCWILDNYCSSISLWVCDVMAAMQHSKCCAEMRGGSSPSIPTTLYKALIVNWLWDLRAYLQVLHYQPVKLIAIFPKVVDAGSLHCYYVFVVGDLWQFSGIWRNGSRSGLKIRFSQESAGSSPAIPTIFNCDVGVMRSTGNNPVVKAGESPRHRSIFRYRISRVPLCRLDMDNPSLASISTAGYSSGELRCLISIFRSGSIPTPATNFVRIIEGSASLRRRSGYPL